MDYLPEWKIYLWKKLLLNTEHFDEGVVIPHNFTFFSDDEQYGLMVQGTGKIIDAVQQARGIAAARRAAVQADSTYQPIGDNYYSSHPINTMGALVELMDSKPPVLTVAAKLGKGYIAQYRQAKKSYETLQYKKSLASISMGKGTPYKPNPDYMSDPFCGLGETIYKKAEAGQVLTTDEFRELAGVAHHRTYDYLVLELKIDIPALQAQMDSYLKNFDAGSLVAPHGVQYFDPTLQRNNTLTAIKAMTTNFGTKNLQVTPVRIAEYGGWPLGDERHYRIFESIFSLEKDGVLVISDLRKSELVLSLNETPPAGASASAQGAKASPARKESVVELKPEIEVGSLVAYSDGSIRYKGKMVELRPQMKDLCRLFMRNQGTVLTHDDIRNAIVDSTKRGATPYTTIAKYVSELHGVLKVHFDRDVITNQNKDGWVFSIKKM
ncbi:MAG TPA: helix-turn-helix domain-containing protein [Candidatus Paceibacterota bacterium]|nr:helix-turn-helix domain-containing protein [Candidatus Paceibacterota bacterium]